MPSDKQLAIGGFQRVADGGACPFCLEVDGAFMYGDDAMPLHNNCGCGVEPVGEVPAGAQTHDDIAQDPNRPVAINQHGELGPVLGNPAEGFTGLGDLADDAVAVLGERPTQVVATSDLQPIQQAIADRALTAIESVHDYPVGMPATSMVSAGVAGGARADFKLLPDGRGVVRFAGDDIPSTPTILHELGHRIDAGLGGTRWATDSAGREVNHVLDTIRDSPAWQRLSEAATENPKGYYLNDQELFARAYAQWIGTRTGVQVGTDLERELGIQWEADEFAPIAASLEDLFRSEGLLK